MKNQNEKNIKRGDIYYYDFGNHPGSIQNGVRPVLVLGCHEGNKAGPLTVVAAMTSSIKKRYLPSHIILNDKYGLRERSMIMLEQLSVIAISDLERYVGYISDPAVIKEIDHALEKLLGIKSYKQKSNEQVQTLCHWCLQDYLHAGGYKIRRLNPYNKIKYPCIKCGRNGYDYAISEYSQKTQ